MYFLRLFDLKIRNRHEKRTEYEVLTKQSPADDILSLVKVIRNLCGISTNVTLILALREKIPGKTGRNRQRKINMESANNWMVNFISITYFIHISGDRESYDF